MQHFIRFIKDYTAQRLQIDSFPTHVVHHAARGSHDNVNAMLELTQLNPEILPSVYRDYMKSVEFGSVFLKGFSHLNSQLASWRQYQGLRFLWSWLDQSWIRAAMRTPPSSRYPSEPAL